MPTFATQVSRNEARLRRMYFNEVMRLVNEHPVQLWEDACQELLEEHNDIERSACHGFSVDGKYYPPSVSSKYSRVRLSKHTEPLTEELVSEFKELYKDLVTDWAKVKLSFTNMLQKALQLAKTEDELGMVIPQAILDQVNEDIDFIPFVNAKGLDKDSALKIKEQYPNAFKVNHYMTIGKLL